MGLGHYNGSIHMKQRGKIERGGGHCVYSGDSQHKGWDKGKYGKYMAKGHG